MSRVTHKLRDQSGVSILMALFLSLVCVVVSAVIFAAGTTVSGRFANLGTMDQRYYGVTSAVELIKDDLEGEEVPVVEKLTYRESSSDTITIQNYDIKVKGASPSKDSASSFAEILAEWLVLGTSTSHGSPTASDVYDWMYELPIGSTTEDSILELSIGDSVVGAARKEQLDVKAQVAIEKDTGNATIVINSTPSNGGNIVYGMQARFTQEGEPDPKSNIDRRPILDGEGNEIDYYYIITVEKTTKLKWTFGDVSTLSRW